MNKQFCRKPNFEIKFVKDNGNNIFAWHVTMVIVIGKSSNSWKLFEVGIGVNSI